MKKDIFTISEFADYIGVSVRTLHYYDSKNILKPKRDEKTGHRIYVHEDLIQLHKIMTLKFLGLSLDDINEYMTQETFDFNFLDTLKMQEAQLVKDKENIETALEAIQRTVHLLEEEQEVDHAILVSLLASMKNEKKQQELTSGIIKDEAMHSMFPEQVKDKMIFEKLMLNFYKNIKSLYGKPADDPEVKQMLDYFHRSVLEAFGLDSVEELVNMYTVNIENQDDAKRMEEYTDEIKRIFPTPLTEKEEKWLEEITANYSAPRLDE